ncbi:MAG: hypothetical protein OEZ19_03955 [Paracoccaceae bacterium]|nr:hypothetical protein [Paracoccaceae bacterium]
MNDNRSRDRPAGPSGGDARGGPGRSMMDHAGDDLEELRRDAARYRWLRSRDLDTIGKGGVFAGMTPENIVLNGDDLDFWIDAWMNREAQS